MDKREASEPQKSRVVMADKNLISLYKLSQIYSSAGRRLESRHKALDSIIEVATEGLILAQAIAFRLSQTEKAEIFIEDHIREGWLFKGTITGSWVAAEDLLKCNPELYTQALTLQMSRYGGIGIDPFDKDADSILNAVASCTMEKYSYGTLSEMTIYELRAKRTSTTILHCAVMRGAVDAVLSLLGVVDVNFQNEYGETPLLCSSQSGNVAISEILLENGADAGVPSKQGDAPLHWLFRFNKTELRTSNIPELLVQANGDFHTRTTTDVCLGLVSHLLGVLPARTTSLYWAMHTHKHWLVGILWSLQANPFLPVDLITDYPRDYFRDRETAIAWAAAFQDDILLASMIRKASVFDNLESEINFQNSFTMPPLYCLIAEKESKLERLVRHGLWASEALKRSIRLLLSHGSSLIFPTVQQSCLTLVVQQRNSDLVGTLLEFDR